MNILHHNSQKTANREGGGITFPPSHSDSVFLVFTETSAYKQMLSGTLSRTPQKAPVLSDDTDDDVEKEFANVLSPTSTK